MDLLRRVLLRAGTLTVGWVVLVTVLRAIGLRYEDRSLPELVGLCGLVFVLGLVYFAVRELLAGRKQPSGST